MRNVSRACGLALILLAGCKSAAALDQEITALEGEIPQITDDASAQAFRQKAQGLADRIRELRVADRQQPGKHLEAVCAKANEHYHDAVIKNAPANERLRRMTENHISVIIWYQEKNPFSWH